MPTVIPSGATGGGSLTVTDGSTTVSATEIDFTGGATVTDGGSGIAQVAVPFISWTAQAASGTPVGGGAEWTLRSQGTIPSSPVSFGNGPFLVTLTAPLTTYAAMAEVFVFDSFSVTASDTSHDFYDLEVNIQVQNESGTQSLALSGLTSITQSPSGGSATLGPGDLTATATTVSDLSYDSENGEVASTLGGSFAAVVTLAGTWD